MDDPGGPGALHHRDRRPCLQWRPDIADAARATGHAPTGDARTTGSGENRSQGKSAMGRRRPCRRDSFLVTRHLVPALLTVIFVVGLLALLGAAGGQTGGLP